LFGWLFALNHNRATGGFRHGWRLACLSSVAAILGIPQRQHRSIIRHQSDFLTSVVQAFTSAIDAKDPYTCGHSDRVARLSVCLARQLGLATADLNLLYMSGLLHDVGKIGIDDVVLRKTDRLTDEEYEQIKLHPELGCDILKDLKPLVSVLPVVRHHHEQWDGKGYPYGLKGLEIPELARITAVADSYDAMSSDRPYRRGMPDEKVDAIFRAGAGTQWDPQVVEAFFACRDQLRELIRDERANLPFDVQAWIE
jgi:HD-GYP domain-containing protein (c-di-GMP phosphodiesterase class II)